MLFDVIVPRHEHFAQVTLRRAWPFQLSETGIDLLRVKGFGIERAAQPFLHGVMLFVLWVPENLEQVVVTPRTAAVLRWTGASAVEAQRHGGGSRIRGQ